jgi:DnaK suppressor protein
VYIKTPHRELPDGAFYLESLAENGGTPMHTNKVEVFRFLLMKQLHELQKAADKTFQELKQDERRYSDPLDRAVKELDRNVELTIRNRERVLIKEIHAAMQRLDQGGFGICETCGEPIAEKRLQAKPTTRLCVHCQASEERANRPLPYLLTVQQIGAFAV